MPGGLADGTGGALPAVSGLANGLLKRMCLAKLKVAAAVLLTVLVGSLADGLSQRAYAEAPTKIDKRHTPPDVREYPGANHLVAMHKHEMTSH